jgi:hypothetical protein
MVVLQGETISGVIGMFTAKCKKQTTVLKLKSKP